MSELEGKVALITGAGSGMGKAATARFVEAGARVVATDISGAEIDTAAPFGDAVLPVHCDVSSEEEVAASVEAALGRFGRLDAMLNVAGVFPSLASELAETDMHDYEHLMGVDLRGVFLGTKHAVQAMRGTGGTILNWSSVVGVRATAQNTSVYAAAKAAVIAVTTATASEYGRLDIRANVICPGIILSDDIVNAPPGSLPPEMEEAIRTQSAKPALGRAGHPDEVADLAVFLASDRAAYITGSVITIDGGWSCRLP